MKPEPPPPLPLAARSSKNTRNRLGIGLVLVLVVVFGVLGVLRACGIIRPFHVPTGAMTPAVSAGDHVFMEGITFLSRSPRRGEVVVFKTDGIASLPANTFYVKRVAGEPGDRLRLADGKLFINEKHISLSNAVGEIVYHLPPGAETMAPQTALTVPKGCFFLLGDNSTNSHDSRFYGSIPRSNIIGRVSFCYWPPGRAGAVK